MIRSVFILFSLILISGHLPGQKVNELLVARNTGLDTLWDGKVIRTMGFAKTIVSNVFIPGPLLTYTEGDSVEIDLWNISQGPPHTIHLHGLDVDQQNDGVGHLSFFVHHMDHGYYRFKAPHPGTYLYHCHVVSPIHVQGGMYGMIVVKPNTPEQLTWEGGHEYHREHNWLTSEVDTNWHKESIIKHHFDTSHHYSLTLPEYKPQYFLINGFAETELTTETAIFSGKANEFIYLRLANIGNYGNTYIFPAALNANIISSDGRPLPTSEMNDTLELTPGERYGVLLHPTEQFDDSIRVLYFNLNTRQVTNTQFVPVNIEGILSENDVPASTENMMTLYPNPAQQVIHIALSEPYKGNLTIYNSMGQVVLSKELFSSDRHKIDMPSNLVNGVYVAVLAGYPGNSVAKFTLAR